MRDMRDMQDMGRELLKGRDPEQLRRLAESEDGRRLSSMLDLGEAERAVRSGDAKQLQALLQKVMATEEGRRLAAQLNGLGNR
ncbi:MAG: hypothetical protein Q4A39_00645 [Eubacteriales bacterium]|nr:hypothetical protein [Eubacteriales bacterium]